MHAHPSPLHPIISIDSFTKWGINFLTCNPHSTGGHGYIIPAVDYFIKWTEPMLTYKDDGETTSNSMFNNVIASFEVPKAIVTDHGSHFRNFITINITTKLGLRHENYTPYYP